MQIVPVIDIRNRVAVRAVAGDRANYRPLVSPLVASNAPLDVATALLSLHPFGAIYIADLDAIEGRGDNREAIDAISRRFPSTKIWIDIGARAAAEADRALVTPNIDPVLGSESLRRTQDVEGLDRKRVLLSLDFKEQKFLGPEPLLHAPHLWPDRVIAMTLARVGANAGPDFARLAQIQAAAPRHSIYAAGGVRNLDDLTQLAAMGVAGALVASALHDGALTSADLTALGAK